MTADIKLLPLYAELQGHPKLEIIKHYARAVAEHSVAARDAEIERLKVVAHGFVDEIAARDAEIEALRGEVAAQRTRADAMAGEAIKHEARAEQLADTLRHLRNHTSVNSYQIELIDAALP